MAVYQVEVNADLSISKIKALQKFSSAKLNRAYKALLKEGMKISSAKPLTKPTQIIVFTFYYGSVGHPSVVSHYEL